MEITSNRIAANPRSKYMKYVSGSSSVIQSQSNIDISNFLKLSGEEDQTVEGNLATTGDIVAYKVSDTPTDVILPIASTTALGVIKVGTNLTISEDGTLNAEAGGGGITEVNWNEIIGTPSWITSTKPSYTYSEITGKPTFSTVAISGSYNDLINKPTIPTNTNQLTNGAGFITSSASISGNAGSATKLQTVRTIWGQSFDGTGNITGDISGTSGIQLNNSRGGKSTAFIWNNANGIHINPNQGNEGFFDIRQSGNVGIGVENPVAKLDVAGNIRASSDIVAYSTGNSSINLSGYLQCDQPDPNGQAGGWSCGVNWTNNYQWIQSHAGRHLLLNPLGNKVGICTYSPSQALSVVGNIIATGSISQSSDIRLKNRLENISNVLDKIDNISVFKYTMKNDDEMSVRCGVSAQEVMVEFPEMVNENSIDEIGDRYFVDYASLATIVAIGGLNELHNKVKEQQKKIDELSLLINKIIDNGNTTI